ncbi:MULTISPECIES: urea amidolyase family protein [unclassified Microbacterium]|uniref:5-oxoprolinase subunit B/C family protein n=1 Tax=unclassified Microbacterium TaxID=2609290 RepID=UPI000EA997DD|nr:MULTISPECIES: urea amidolyase family protein [unclassified Microbacterium]MBT2484459.1 5-oxoprolinase/urea amidolyase family protein [Microbacterium sp. ISL-108]RKN67366.1 carboxyltransferase domain-containing protein [Microbacterium sp. CGR2]
MRILTASDRALLIEAADLDEAMRLNLAWGGVTGVVELIPGARTVLVRFDPLQISAADLGAVLAQTHVDAEHAPVVREVTIPVHYDGEDLDEVAALLGVSAEEVVARHLAAEWRVAFSGFAPGFGYAASSDPLFDVPRRSSPRTRVPAGSVALAGNFTGVYPRESPGGWQLIGRTEAVMWDIERDPPALLSPGTLARFERLGPETVSAASGRGAASASSAASESADDSAAPPHAMPPSAAAQGDGLGFDAPRRIEVVRSSLQLLVQDLGRPGHAALGVSASGVADRTAMRDANRAVGNDAHTAVLESVGGMLLRFQGAEVATVTGATGALTLTDRDGASRVVPHGAPFALADGDELLFGHPERGLRYVVAVRGGIRALSALGSVSTDTLAGLGPAPLAAGDVVELGDPRTAPHSVAPLSIPRALPGPGETVELEITLGPRDDWFTASALETLTRQVWEVTPRSDRVGIRLAGEIPLERAVTGELPSEGAITGAIQVPPDGQPVLFLPDHPLTGGYPIIAAVTDRSLDIAGQLAPGVRIRLVVKETP